MPINAFKTGRLALGAGAQIVNLPFDDVLTEEEYHFVIDGPYGDLNPTCGLHPILDPLP